jgi:hypothetical protein
VDVSQFSSYINHKAIHIMNSKKRASSNRSDQAQKNKAIDKGSEIIIIAQAVELLASLLYFPYIHTLNPSSCSLLNLSTILR